MTDFETSLVTDELTTEEYTEIVETFSEVPESSGLDTGVILGVFLPPFFIIIFLISVILVLALKKR